jgi:O-antigen ligase
MTGVSGPPAELEPAPFPRPQRSIDRLLSRIGSRLERVFVVFLLLNLSGSTIPPQRPSLQATFAPVGENSLVDSAFALLYLVLAALIVLRFARFARTAVAHKLTLVVLLIAGMSFFWSTSPETTLRRTIAILVTTAFGWYVASRYTMRETLESIAWALGITGLISLFYGIVDPGVATLPSEGTAWRGVYDTKNALARVMVLGAISGLLLTLERRRRRWPVWAGIGLSVGMMGMSQSATGLIVFCTLVMTMKFAGTLRLRPIVLVPSLIALALLLAGGVIWLRFNDAAMAGTLGKDVTMTGRTELWSVAMLFIEQRPWLGYGYSSFWRGATGPSGAFWAAVGWPTPHSHNGFLDLTLDLGLLGLVAFLAACGSVFIAAIRRARTARSTDAVAPLVLLAYTVFYNLTESSILRHNSLFWVVYVVAAAGACGGVRRETAPGLGVPASR